MDEKVFAGSKKIERDLTASLNAFAESCKHFAIDKESDKNKEIVRRIRKLTVYVSEDYAIQNGLDILCQQSHFFLPLHKSQAR